LSDVGQLKLEKVTERTTAAISKLDFNAGGIALDNFVIAVDSTMFPLTGRLLRKRMEKKFGLPVKFLFLTHYHGDHFWGVSSFRDMTIVAATPLLQNAIAEREIQPAAFERMKENEPEKAHLIDEIDTAFLPNVCFQNKLEIRDGDLTVELYHCGGHTSCSAYAYFPHEKVLFAGDLIFAKEWPWAGDPTSDPELWINALQAMANLDFERLVPGHGPIVGKDEVEMHLALFRQLKKETKAILARGKGVDSMGVPPFYKDSTPGEWVRKDTLKCFYKFYQS
jgi:glyoxylase-like metal-dependent hydrolase (beta-lactamase superfamily II)